MSPSAELGWCQVSGAQKLPAEAGGADALCAAVGQALAKVSPKPQTVELSVLSPFMISATVVMADGRRLPAVKVGSADRPLGARAIRMLADGIAAQVAGRQS